MLMMPISSLYIPVFAIFLVVITLRIGTYRRRNRINLGDGGDPKFLRMIRGQGNFIELVPMALILLVLMEITGASGTLLHGLFIALLVGRVLHYLQLTGVFKPLLFRPLGMVLTLGTILVASCYLLLNIS